MFAVGGAFAQAPGWYAHHTGRGGTALVYAETAKPGAAGIEAYCERGRIVSFIVSAPASDVRPGARVTVALSSANRTVTLSGDALDRSTDRLDVGVKVGLKHRIFDVLGAGAEIRLEIGGAAYSLPGAGARQAVASFRDC